MSNRTWTSEEANERSEPFKRGTQMKVFAYLHGQGKHGATDQEIEDGTGIPGNSERPARLSLEKEGAIKRTKRTRLTRAGFPAIVWVVKRDTLEDTPDKTGPQPPVNPE